MEGKTMGVCRPVEKENVSAIQLEKGRGHEKRRRKKNMKKKNQQQDSMTEHQRVVGEADGARRGGAALFCSAPLLRCTHCTSKAWA